MFALSAPQDLYQKILKATLLAELNFLLDVAQGRVPARKTIEDKLQAAVVDITSDIVSGFPGGGIVVKLFTAVGSSVFDEMQEEENNQSALLRSLLTMLPGQLEKITARVAREASCRWDMAIHGFRDEAGVQSFAVTGARRIVEYLHRKNAPITVKDLLFGLIAGRSGKGYSALFANAKIPLSEKMHKCVAETVTAEGVYGRSGYFIGNDFYISDRVLKRSNFQDFRVQRRPEEGHFGYPNLKMNVKAAPWDEQRDNKFPKPGYVQLPIVEELDSIANTRDHGYKFTVHSQNHPIIKNFTKNSKARYVTEKEIHEYLESIKGLKDNIPSLNEKCGAVVFFRGHLGGTKQKPLVLSKANFNGSDFSGCTLEHCILGNCQKLYLSQATLLNVQASGNSLDQAHLDMSTIQNCDFGGLTGTEIDLSYAKIVDSDFRNIVGHGLILNYADIDKETKERFDLDYQKRIDELTRAQMAAKKKLKQENKRNWTAIRTQQQVMSVLAAQLKTQDEQHKKCTEELEREKQARQALENRLGQETKVREELENRLERETKAREELEGRVIALEANTSSATRQTNTATTAPPTMSTPAVAPIPVQVTQPMSSVVAITAATTTASSASSAQPASSIAVTSVTPTTTTAAPTELLPMFSSSAQPVQLHTPASAVTPTVPAVVAATAPPPRESNFDRVRRQRTDPLDRDHVYPHRRPQPAPPTVAPIVPAVVAATAPPPRESNFDRIRRHMNDPLGRAYKNSPHYDPNYR